MNNMKCDHTDIEDVNVVVIAGVINRNMKVCKDCRKVIEVTDYEVE